MENNSRTLLVSQTRVKPTKQSEFQEWLDQLQKEVAVFPGYISSEIRKPNPPVDIDWIIILYFASRDAAKAWLQSDERQSLIQKSLSLIVGVDNLYLMDENHHEQATSTAILSTKVHEKDADKFLEWQSKIAPIQSKFAGFIGYKIEKPKPGVTNDWNAIITFDSDKHLEDWLNSTTRKQLLEELDAFSIENRVQKIHSGFGFWFDKDTRSQRLIWKENMLVLLTLYPVVFLLSYIQNYLARKGMPFWLGLFFSNAASTSILGWITTPWLMKHFDWWLHPQKGNQRNTTLLGITIVIALYLLSLLLCWFIYTAIY